MKYSEKLKDPRWQKLRLEVFERDEWTCNACCASENTLNVHHSYYYPEKEPWEYPLDSFITLCDNCHNLEKEERPSAEKKLLLTLKKKQFFAKDIIKISEGFKHVRIYHAPEVTASIIKWILETPDLFNKLGDMFFQYLKEENLKGIT